MNSFVPPAFILIIGALLIPLFRGRVKQAYIVILPCLAFISLLMAPEGLYGVIKFMDYELVLGRVDRLSRIFGYIFTIMCFATAIFSLHLKDKAEVIAGFVYVGSALGAVFAGDYLTLYIFWEIMAFSSVCLICARRNERSKGAAFRYILVHLFGGLMLMTGILMQVSQTGSLAFDYLGLNSVGSYFILIGFAVNAAMVPFSAWLSDAYPEATVVGTVFLSAFTTKTAVYTLARAFPGTEILVWAGIIMAIYGIVFAILENDMRRILAYSIINQVGFMVVGIGIGTELAINGAASHAFAHILYKGLLLMSAGAVLYMTGKSKCTELGGLYKSMPITLILCVIGAASISGVPLTGGFVTKSMIAAAAGHEGMVVIWFLLTLASAGVFLHAGIKFPYFVFFAKDSGLRPKEAPVNMLVGMGVLAFLCIFIGIFPGVIYRILPYPVDYVPYTTAHVYTQLQLLAFSGLAFFMLLKFLKRTETLTLDTDWFYRKAGPAVIGYLGQPIVTLVQVLGKVFYETIPASLLWFGRNPYTTFKAAYNAAYSWVAWDEDVPSAQPQVSKWPSYLGGESKDWSIGSAATFITLFFILVLVVGRIIG